MKTAKAILEDTYLEAWTVAQIKSQAKDLRKANQCRDSDGKANGRQTELFWKITEVLSDIETLENYLVEANAGHKVKYWVETSGGEEKTESLPDGIARLALAVGLRWSAIQHFLDHPRGKGKQEAPEWKFIRRAWKTAKGNRKAAIANGIGAAEKAGISIKPGWQFAKYLSHWKKRVATKRSR